MKKSLFATLLLAVSLFVTAQPKGAVMIDVSRHFMPIDMLYRQVDALSHYGISVLHLHLTDAAGWRLEIKRYKRLTELAAWRTADRWQEWWNDGKRAYVDVTLHPELAHGGYYTQDEMRALVKYAAEHGVTIMPEIEFPAHSEEVLTAYPELCCTGEPYICADFCIGSDTAYTFIRNVLEEVVDIFPSEYIHLGGDEAGGTHWKTCPRCKDMPQIEAMRKVNAIVQGLGRKMVCWDEVLTDDPADSSIVIMVWRNMEQIEKAMRLGHDVMLSPSRYCYLDQYQDAPPYEPQAMGGYLPLRDIYDYFTSMKLMGGGATNDVSAYQRKILTVSLNLWTEYVETPQWAERMLWPRCLTLTLLQPGSKTYADTYEKFHAWAIAQLPWLREHGITPFDLDKERGERPEKAQKVEALSVGKRVTYLQPFHRYYPAAEGATLTDGLQGGWRNTDGRWQGFLSPFDVYVDLRKKTKIQEIAITFMQCRGPEIFLPSSVTFEVSNNGKKWTPLYTEPIPEDMTSIVFKTTTWKGSKKARYIRCKAAPNIRGGWLFTDELIIR